jgi:ABC-type transport system substrate-binding protein
VSTLSFPLLPQGDLSDEKVDDICSFCLQSYPLLFDLQLLTETLPCRKRYKDRYSSLRKSDRTPGPRSAYNHRSTEFHILGSLFEGLVNLDPKDLSPLPGAAHSWEVSDDGLAYTFHLRNGARWSNGDPLKASDFVFSFQRILSPALGAEYAYMLYCIKNARDFNTSKISDFSLVGAKAPDDSTLVIELDKPTPYFLSLTAHHSFFPVNPSTILKHGKIDTRGTPWTRRAIWWAMAPLS